MHFVIDINESQMAQDTFFDLDSIAHINVTMSDVLFLLLIIRKTVQFLQRQTMTNKIFKCRI